MLTIKEIERHIDAELKDAEDYARSAMINRDSNAELARTYMQLANDETGHANQLHAHVVRLIDSYSREHGEPPASMKAVYDYLHENQIERVADIKRMLADK